MKKISKESLAHLAEVMPQLSENEQRECVGGKVVIVDRNGNVLRGNSQIINGYTKLESDTENVYWYVMGKDGNIQSSYKSAGSVSNNNPNGAMNNMDFEGTGINKNVMAFLSENTNVEWGMALREDEATSGYYGRLNTSNDPGQVDVLDYGTGYTEWYHSHPFDDRRGNEFGPSSGDYEVVSMLTDEKNGYNYKKCTVYEARTGEWITFYGKKSEGEVYENEMTRP